MVGRRRLGVSLDDADGAIIVLGRHVLCHGAELCRGLLLSFTCGLGETLSLDREVNDSSPNLHSFVKSRQKGRALLDQDKRTELALVVLQEELALLELDFRVAPTNRNIIDAQIALMAAPELEDCLVGSGADDVNDARCVLFLGETLQHHVIALGLIVLNQVVVLRAGLHHQRVRGLADFALEGLPEVGGEVGLQLGLLLGLKPARQATIVDLSHGASTAASTEERVLLGGIGRPAEAALVLGVLLRHVLEGAWHCDEFLELLILAV